MSALKKVLIFTACVEVVTGLALLIVPSRVGRLLFGEGLNGIAIPIARMTGIALIALGVACWPGPPQVGMLTYGGPGLSHSILPTLVLPVGSPASYCGRQSFST